MKNDTSLQKPAVKQRVTTQIYLRINNTMAKRRNPLKNFWEIIIFLKAQLLKCVSGGKFSIYNEVC